MKENFISGGKMEIHPNEQCRLFHMRHELMPRGGYFNSDGIVCDKWKGNEFPLTRTTIEALGDIKGVLSVSVKPYEITIVKAGAFSWEELLPKIKLEMSKHLPSQYN